MNLTTKIILVLIVFHLLLGFGWLFYKLLPGKEDRKHPDETSSSEKDTSPPAMPPGKK
jgi:hypothetical protein